MKLMKTPNGFSKDIVDWKKKARLKQQGYMRLLKSRPMETYSPKDYPYLALKIGFILFGLKPETQNVKYVKDYKFSHDEQVEINHFIRLLKDISGKSIKIGFIFLICKSTSEEWDYPVLKVAVHSRNKKVFVDPFKRTYATWDKFLRNNKIPPCVYCYPSCGKYKRLQNKKLSLEIGYSPQSKLGVRIASKLDALNDSISLGSVGLCVATALTAPLSGQILLGATVLGASSALWRTARNIRHLVDRKIHGQNSGFRNREARSHWLNIATGMVGAVSNASLIQSARFIDIGRAVNAVTTVTTAAATCAAAVDQVGDIVTKKNIDMRDVFTLASGIFFFTDSVINIRIASYILRHPNEVKMPNQPVGRKLADKFKETIVDNKNDVYKAVTSFCRKILKLRGRQKAQKSTFVPKKISLKKIQQRQDKLRSHTSSVLKGIRKR